MREAIYAELALALIGDWQPGKYKSSRGLMNISEMNEAHLTNALNDLKRKRELRAQLVFDLVSDGDLIDSIKELYMSEKDLLALKIIELEEELESR